MWNPQSLRITNLFSHQGTVIEFKNNQMTTIYGVNKTDSNVQSNGSGKTSILDCISIALLGEPLRDISKKEIVRNGEKSGSCELVLRNNILGKELRIVREINSTKSSNALIYENGTLNTQLKDLSPSETDKYIIKLLGISKDDLRNYFLISKDSYQSFFLNGDAAKKEIINRFSKANIIDGTELLIKEDVRILEASIQEFINQKNSNNGVLNHLNDEISKEKLESSIEKTRELTIKALQERKETAEKLCDELPEKIEAKEAEIVIVRDRIEDQETILNKMNDLLKEEKDATWNIEKEFGEKQAVQYDFEKSFEPKIKLLNDEINKEESSLEVKLFKNSEELEIIDTKFSILFKEVDKHIETHQQEIADCNENIREINQVISEIEKQLADKIDCPKCNHSFILRNESFNLEHSLNDLSLNKQTIIDIQSLIEENNQYISTWRNRITELKETQKIEREANLTERNTLRSTSEEVIRIIKSQIDKLKKEIEEGSKEFISLKKETDKKIAEQNEVIKEIKKEIVKQELSISEEQRNMSNLKRELGELDGKASFYIQQRNDCISAIEKERNKVYLDKTAEIQVKIDTLTIQNEELKKQIDQLESDKSVLLEWQSKFKQFKSFLANSSISSIESMTNFFLEKMKTNLRVSIDGYRELSNKKLKEEITTLVNRDGLNGESFSKFSGGEKARVDLACILSMQKIINIAAEGGGLNLLFIDEILESVDSTALSEIVKALSQLEQTIMLITHVDQNDFNCNKIIVEKINGISRIKS